MAHAVSPVSAERTFRLTEGLSSSLVSRWQLSDIVALPDPSSSPMEEVPEPMFGLPATPALILQTYDCRDRCGVSGFLLLHEDAMMALFAGLPYIEHFFPGSRAELTLDRSLGGQREAVLVATIRSNADPERAVEALELLDDALWRAGAYVDDLLFDAGPSA